MTRVSTLGLVFVAALVGGLSVPAAAQKGPCAMDGVEPGMTSDDVIAALGRPAIQMKNDSPTGQGTITTMGWTTADAVVEVDVNDKAQVVRVYRNQKQKMLKAPFGVRLGKDDLRQAVRRIGEESIAVGPARCTGNKVQVPFSATCSDDGTKFTFLLDVPTGTIACDAAPAKEGLIDSMGRTLIREAVVER